MLFNVSKPIEYYVDSDGVRSPTYSMKVVNLPAVENLELEYVFPAYTGLPPQKVESGGDVAALRGTEVRVRVKPTMATATGRLQLDPQSSAELKGEADGTLAGSFKIDQDGFYHVELDGPRGEHVTASPKFTVDAIEDQPPAVSFEKPKRDVQANPVEEVFVQARADDDYGVKQLDLVYSVNGGPEKTIDLYGNGAKSLKEVSVGPYGLPRGARGQAGRLRRVLREGAGQRHGQGAEERDERHLFHSCALADPELPGGAVQGGGGGGGGGGGNQAAGLAQQEKEIISATLNVDRDRPKTPADKFKENTVFIGLSQSKLRDQVEELVQQLNQRLGGSNENMRKIAEMLPKAIEEMKVAEKNLQGLKTKDAMAPEYRALKFLQDAEELYDLEVPAAAAGWRRWRRRRTTDGGRPRRPVPVAGRPHGQPVRAAAEREPAECGAEDR